MKGYASQIVPQDRWAIVAYVRALQATQGLESAPAGLPAGVEFEDVPTVDDLRVSDAAAGDPSEGDAR